jgi:hypothetical protein
MVTVPTVACVPAMACVDSSGRCSMLAVLRAMGVIAVVVLMVALVSRRTGVRVSVALGVQGGAVAAMVFV